MLEDCSAVHERIVNTTVDSRNSFIAAPLSEILLLRTVGLELQRAALHGQVLEAVAVNAKLNLRRAANLQSL